MRAAVWRLVGRGRDGMPVRPALLLAALLGLVLLTAPAAAQGLGWFGNLFGGFPRPNSGAPAYPGYGNDGYAPRSQSDRSYSRPRRRAVRRVPVEPAPREVAKVPPKNASLSVAVFGDSLGQMLGQGLDEALADRADVAVVQKARSGTGLVADNYYDWPKAIDELLGRRSKGDARPGDAKSGDAKSGDAKSGDAKSADPKSGDAKSGEGRTGTAKAGDGKPREKIDVAVMMIGINDHQPLTVDGKVLQPGTSDWTNAYAKRVMLIDDAFRSRGIPLIWVGVPITKDDAFADAMAGLNDVYREAAAKSGATYVDTWEAFSDDNGNFAAYGPDVNGQTVRLRAADGIHFTKAGARKLAHFVEVHVRRALEGKMPVPQLPAEVSDSRDKGERKLAVARPDIGPVHNLNEAPVAANGALAALDPRGAATTRSDDRDPSADARERGDAERPLKTSAQAVPLGRADDARWSDGARAEP